LPAAARRVFATGGGGTGKLFNYCTIVKKISVVYLLVHWCDLSLTLAKVGL